MLFNLQKLRTLKEPLFVVIAIAVLFVVAGCNTPGKMNTLMASWEGHNINDLIASWGPPNGTMSDGQGGQILIYDQSRTMVLPGSVVTTSNYNATTTGNVYGNQNYANYNANTYGNGYSQTTYTPPTAIPINRKRLFWVNSSGTIYRWSWQGL